MTLFELLVPLAVFIRLACFDWNAAKGKSVAVLVAFSWLIWTIAMGSRPA